MRVTKLATLLLALTLVSGTALMSSVVSADDSVVDEINITVPVSCTISGVGMNSHNTTINNGIYTPDIGTTTLHAFCNDAEGFAIYAAGFTGDEVGGTNSNKLVGTAASGNETIVTGLATSAGNPDVSNWAMKLAITQDSGNTTGTNAFTIDAAPNVANGADASFSNYHVVPNEYTKVAHKNSGTDMTASTGGVKLTTTYAAYISKTQPADTYSGQVIYTLVHPATAPEPVGENRIGVIYDGNGLHFDQAGTKSINKVIYERSCEDEYGYVADTPTILKTRNLSADGTQSGPYSYEGSPFYEGDGLDPSWAEFEGASKIKMVIRYGLSAYNGYIGVAIDGDSIEDRNIGGCGELCNMDIDRAGTVTFVGNGSSVSIYSELGYNETNSGYDYGVYAQVYPVYDEPMEGTTYGVVQNVCSYHSVIGSYAETAEWVDGDNYWYNFENNGDKNYFDYETVDEYGYDSHGVTRYLRKNEERLLGSTFTVYAYNPYKIVYDGNNATAGMMDGFYTTFDSNTVDYTADLMAPNYKKTGYGFAGWSEDQNAIVNSSSKIYGPNEKVAGDEFAFDSNTRETTLYSVWVPTAGNMQGFSCSSLTDGQIIALTDNRDNNVYTVGKMQDGNCWMMENLRLDNTAIALSLSNTNNPVSGFTTLSATSDSWCTNVNSSCTNRSNLNTNNTNIGGVNSLGTTLVVAPGRWNGAYSNVNQEIEGNGSSVQWYGYGNYYNWYSATTGNGSFSSVSGEVTNGDICPNGWHLPYGGSGTGVKGGGVSGGFSYLDIRMGGTGNGQNDDSGEEIVSNRWRSFPNNFIYSGYIYGNPRSRGSNGVYWSSTALLSNAAYALSFSSDGISPGLSNMSRIWGSSVRCLTAPSS